MKKFRLRFGGQPHRLDERTWNRFTERKRVVASESDFVVTEKLHRVAQHRLIVHERVDVKTTEVFFGIDRVIDRTEIGAHVETVGDPTHRRRESATAVREQHPQLR